MRFQLVVKSTTLNGPFTLCFKIHVFSEPSTKISMKIDPYYQRHRCSTMAVVYGNIRFMRIFAGIHWRRGIKQQGQVSNQLMRESE